MAKVKTIVDNSDQISVKDMAETVAIHAVQILIGIAGVAYGGFTVGLLYIAIRLLRSLSLESGYNAVGSFFGAVALIWLFIELTHIAGGILREGIKLIIRRQKQREKREKAYKRAEEKY